MDAYRQSLRALAAALVLISSTAGVLWAADGEVTFGTQWWDQTVREAKFQEFRDIPNGPVFESFVYLDNLKQGRFAFIGKDVLQQDQSLTGLFHKPRWTAWAEYSRTPHHFSFETRTPYTEVSPGVFALPDTLQLFIQNNPTAYASTMRDLLNTSAQRVPLDLRTDIGRARLKARLPQSFHFDVRGVRRQRTGGKPFGASFGFNHAIELIEHIDQSMITTDARLSYLKKKLSLEGSIGYEGFDNDIDTLVWDNPKRLTDRTYASGYVAGDAVSRGRTALYPDNQTIRGTFKAGYQLPYRTAFTGFVQLAQTTQDERWLPFTTNTAILEPDTFALPGTNTDGKVRTFTQDYRLTGSPSRYVSGTLRFRRHDVENKTPTYFFPGYVRFDQVWEDVPWFTNPLSYTHTTYGLDLDLIPLATRRIVLSGLLEQNIRDRTHREVLEDKETVYGGRVKVWPRSGLDLEAEYRHGDRELEEFEIEDYENLAGQIIEQPTLRRFDIGNRVQDLIRASMGWIPIERFHLSAGYEYRRNQYEDDELAPMDAPPVLTGASDLQLGLLDDSRRSVSADAAYELSEKVELRGGYGWVQIYSNQRSRESGAVLAQNDSTTWQARLKDWFTYANAQITWRPVSRIALTGTYEFERSPGVYRLTNFLRTARDLPGTKYERQGIGTEAWYRVDDGFSLGARWGWEQFEVSDFAVEDVPLLFPATGNVNAIFLGDEIRDYRAHTVALLVRRTF